MTGGQLSMVNGQWSVMVALIMACLFANGCGSKGAQSATNSGASTQPVGAPAPAPVKTSKKNAELNRWLADVDVVVPPTTYRVDPPDEILISAPAVKELDKTKTRVRSDGKISLNLVGELYIAGLSPSEISEELTQRLSKFYTKDS